MGGPCVAAPVLHEMSRTRLPPTKRAHSSRGLRLSCAIPSRRERTFISHGEIHTSERQSTQRFCGSVQPPAPPAAKSLPRLITWMTLKSPGKKYLYIYLLFIVNSCIPKFTVFTSTLYYRVPFNSFPLFSVSYYSFDNVFKVSRHPLKWRMLVTRLFRGCVGPLHCLSVWSSSAFICIFPSSRAMPAVRYGGFFRGISTLGFGKGCDQF